ncbi:MAG: hypothetical protein HRU71_02495 [Planctomycetia bacterium]|nr:MAG: hypothetical protein HRU71_02495 [Planctomycetia bacterium]
MRPAQRRSAATSHVSRGLAMNRWNHRARRLLVVAAALPILQGTGCFPDPIGALNFQLQQLVNTTLIDWVSVIVANIFRL